MMELMGIEDFVVEDRFLSKHKNKKKRTLVSCMV